MSDLSELSNAKHVVINQRIEWLECIPCYEEANEYAHILLTTISLLWKFNSLFDRYEISTSDVNFSTKKTHIGTVVEKPGSAVCLFCCKQLREYENEFQVNSYPVASSSRPYKYKFLL